MKTVAVFAFVCLSFLEIQAQDQIKQGVCSLGGSIYYSSKTTIWDENEESFIVSPNLTYFITDQTELFFSCLYSVTTLRIYPYYRPQPLCKKDIALSLGLRYYFPAGRMLHLLDQADS
ncbi:MAG: hypothetical protein JXA06_07690 [Bacteroidetes bacterium]|nr:hypothetical protein [Bacteroidota bacterium]